MNENDENIAEENGSDWEAPPLPEKIAMELPEMSEAGTLGNIFLEPGRTFRDLKIKPRFILAGLIVALAFGAFQILFIEKIGLETIVRAKMDASSRGQQMPADQKQTMIEQQSGPIAKYITYAVTPIIIIASFFIGGLIYFGGINAMGGEANYLQGVSIWIYASLPPTILFVIVNVIILFLKSADEIDLVNNQGNLAPTSLAFFANASQTPVLAAILATFDLFTIFGWVLAVMGLKTIGKISSVSAWSIVLIVGLIGMAFRVLGALFS